MGWLVQEKPTSWLIPVLPLVRIYKVVKMPMREGLRLTPTMDARVLDHPRRDSEEDWFYIYDYYLTTLGVYMPFTNFQMRGTGMATMRRAFLAQLAQTTAPQPLNILRDLPLSLLGLKRDHPDYKRRTKQKRDSRAVSDPAGDGGKKQKQQRVKLKVGASDSRTPNKAPSVWDEHFIHHRNVRDSVDDLIYTDEDKKFLETQSPLDICRQATTHLLKAALSVRHMEKHYLPLLKRSEEDRKEALAKHSKDLTIRDRDEMNGKYEVTLAQVKGAEDQYLEAKEENDKMLKDLQAAQTGLENALKELEESKKSRVDLEAKVSAFEDTESELGKLQEKYNDVLLHLGEDVYQNTIQQLIILNPSLVMHGSAPHAYMDNGVIMVGALQVPVPFVPKTDDHQEAKHSGTDQQSQRQKEEVESKNRAINLD
ncbi:unconventional myosin-Va-like isoform X1 [Sesbania bispinosa]|nr:unconventional myosin-Va-like isoform X1 [Sesbania bispinosa]